MSQAAPGTNGLNYAPCQYGASRLVFRGPKRATDGPYMACLGGSATYGRFVRAPFADQVETMVGMPCVNFGVRNAGVDLFLNEPVLLDVAFSASVKVMQVIGAQNMSNRFYTVHPRRNDRFLQASPRLQRLYPQVDFTEFHFTRHMLSHLYRLSDTVFQEVVQELQTAWVARMKLLLGALGENTILLWVHSAAPPQKAGALLSDGPLFITQDMLAKVRSRTCQYLEYSPSQAALSEGLNGLVFSEVEAPAAQGTLGHLAHQEVATQIGQAAAHLMASHT